MRSDFLLILGLLAAAIPVWADQRCSSRPNSCFIKAKACPRECSSFMRATITPCLITRTVLTTAYVTESTAKAIVTATSTATDFFSTILTSSSTTTLQDTLTITNTIVESATTTVEDRTTTTKTMFEISIPIRKRAIDPNYIEPLPIISSNAIKARSYSISPRPTTSKCNPTTARPSKVPATASAACHGPAQFSSACACAGIRPTTTTLLPRTTTVTHTLTRTMTPTASRSITTIKTRVALTSTRTTVALSTFETTVATQTAIETTATTATVISTVVETVTTTKIDTTVPLPVTPIVTSKDPTDTDSSTKDSSTAETSTMNTATTETATPTETGVDTSTTTALPSPTCTSYNLVYSDKDLPIGDQYLLGNQPDPKTIETGYLWFSSSITHASAWTLRPNGRLYGQGDVYGLASISGASGQYVAQMTEASQSAYSSEGWRFLTCSITPGGTDVPNAAGILSCVIEKTSTAINLGVCNWVLLAQWEGSNPNFSDCRAITLAAVAVGVTAC